MGKRPTSITVIAWILIITGGISLITSTVSLKNNLMVKEIMIRTPMPIPVQYAMMYIGLLVSIVSGIGMLKKQNWARFLYIIWGIIGFLVGLFTYPMKIALIPCLLFFVIIVFFSFSPGANEYFSEV